jgi:hypothetical protein
LERLKVFETDFFYRLDLRLLVVVHGIWIGFQKLNYDLIWATANLKCKLAPKHNSSYSLTIIA